MIMKGWGLMIFDEHIIFDSRDVAMIKTFHSCTQPRKSQYIGHHHTECELSLFISGSGLYTVNGKEYPFQSGDMFLFGSNETHCITDVYTEVDVLNIHFEPRILWESSETIELLDLFFSRNKNFSNKFSKNDYKLHDIIVNIQTEVARQNTGYKLQVKYLLFSALIYIMRQYDYINTDSSHNIYGGARHNLKEAMRYIDDNLENKLSLKEISDIACMSPTYFSAVFKSFNGISPWDYITIKRVENAIEMIKTTDMTKIEIAEKCGFSSSSNFYKAFVKVTGKTPKNYEP